MAATSRAATALLASAVASVALLTGCGTASTTTTAPALQDAGAHTAPDARYTTPGRVVRVVDGDTLIADLGGKRVRIRLIGVNSPESVKPNSLVECYGPEASAFTKSIATPGRAVRVERDPVVGETDRYGRTLAYVWTDDPSSLNERLISAGVAREYDFDDQRYRLRDQFRADEDRARADRVGLWGQCPR